MEFTGKIIAILQPRGGVSKASGNEWKAQEYVIEDHGQYPRKMCFDVFGADKIEQFNIQMGEEPDGYLSTSTHVSGKTAGSTVSAHGKWNVSAQQRQRLQREHRFRRPLRPQRRNSYPETQRTTCLSNLRIKN